MKPFIFKSSNKRKNNKLNKTENLQSKRARQYLFIFAINLNTNACSSKEKYEGLKNPCEC